MNGNPHGSRVILTTLTTAFKTSSYIRFNL
jgi:hypothetical protein